MKNALLIASCLITITSITTFSCKTKKQTPPSAVSIIPAPSPAETKKAGYTADIKNTFDYFCMPCHSTNEHARGIILDTYLGTKTAASEKNFMSAINHENGFAPMPPNLNGAKLAPETIRTINTWIQNGMSE